MPNRLLREGICSSDAIESLSPELEVMFYRLLVVCDDYGYMDARPPILKAQCFPLKDSATQAKIQSWIDELAKQGLIAVYEKDNKQFLAICKWEQRARSRQKYPGPMDEGCQSIDRQLSDNCQTDDRLGWGWGWGGGKGAHSERLGNCQTIDGQLPDNGQTDDRLGRGKGKGAHSARFDRFWFAYPRKVAKRDALKAWMKISADDDLTEKIVTAVISAKTSVQWLNEGGKYIPFPATWLNRGQWEDSGIEADKRMVM